MRWVLGDIHGMIGPLEAMLEAVSRLDHHPQFWFVGDYVNRGPDSRKVIELLLTLEHASFCRGNHDDVLDLILSGEWLGGEEDAYDPQSACLWFLKHGLVETLLSYGLDAAELDYMRYQAPDLLLPRIRQAVPERHRAFIRRLPMVIEAKDALVAHAFWPPQEPNDAETLLRRLDDAETRHRVVWERYRQPQIESDKPWHRPGFFGHTPVSNYPGAMRQNANVPIHGPKITLLDTAIALGNEGRLSAICIEDRRCIQINRSCRVVG